MKKNTKRAAAAAASSYSGEANIYRASEFKQNLLNALASPHSIEVDLSGITEIDSSGIQILLAAKKSAVSKNKELRYVGHSPAVVEAALLLGLGAHFNMDASQGAQQAKGA